MISLVIPAHSSGENLQRTIDSCKGVCSETVVVSTAPYADDREAIARQADVVVSLPWNTVFTTGYGCLPNHGADAARNDWLLLLGVGSTFAEAHRDMRTAIVNAKRDRVFLCDHRNESHHWRRIWNRRGVSVNGEPIRWSGLIHEDLTGGDSHGTPLFRMQDTRKAPHPDPVRQEVFRHIKSCSYNHLYRRLREHPQELSTTDPGWLQYVNDNRERHDAFLADHRDLVEAAIDGNFPRFEAIVEARYRSGRRAYGVNYNPQGEPEHETPKD